MSGCVEHRSEKERSRCCVPTAARAYTSTVLIVHLNFISTVHVPVVSIGLSMDDCKLSFYLCLKNSMSHDRTPCHMIGPLPHLHLLLPPSSDPFLPIR